MSKKTGLGKGLDALIPAGDFLPPPATEPQAAPPRLPIQAIVPNPRQPRAHFDPQELAELTASIREHGVLQPIIVTQGPQPDQYTLIAGERRLLAARQAGLETIPALVREASDQERLELALIENVQRADLSPLEAAEAYRQLGADFGLSHEAIAGRVGKSRTAITNTLRLLKLPAAVQQALADQQITEGHARALLTLSSAAAQTAALQTILKRGLNVRQTEDLVRLLSGQKPTPPARPAPPPEIIDLEARLRARLNTKVSVNRRRKGGTLTIHYYSDEELDALVDQLLGS